MLLTEILLQSLAIFGEVSRVLLISHFSCLSHQLSSRSSFFYDCCISGDVGTLQFVDGILMSGRQTLDQTVISSRLAVNRDSVLVVPCSQRRKSYSGRVFRMHKRS